MPDKPRKFDLATLFGALADQTRLRLLNLMGDDEVCVCYLVDVLQTNQPKVSRHLAYLRRAGIVAARRDGKWMHYRIVRPADTSGARILNEVLSSVSEKPEMKQDRKRLKELCSSSSTPVQLVRAPRPARIA